MRVFLTGGTGFVGGAVARLLRARGDDVVALVRNPAHAESLAALGVTLVQGDLGDDYVMRTAMENVDALLHVAAHYEVGIRPRDRAAMFESNVRGTERILTAALELDVPKTVYVSSVVALGNTEGAIVDETHEHSRRYTSCYEETKHLAHQSARDLIDKGLPCVIVLPASIYGPGDHSQLGNQVEQFLKGRLPMLAFSDVGLTFVHRDDVAAGILLALDRGVPGEEYILAGEIGTLRSLMETAARVAGRRPPRRDVPPALVRALAPFGSVLAPAMRLLGLPPNLREAVSSVDGVSFWATDEKARRELGWTRRSLEQGVRDWFTAEGRI